MAVETIDHVVNQETRQTVAARIALVEGTAAAFPISGSLLEKAATLISR